MRSSEELKKLVLGVLNYKTYVSISFIRRTINSDYYTITNVLKILENEHLIDIIQTSNGKAFKLTNIPDMSVSP